MELNLQKTFNSKDSSVMLGQETRDNLSQTDTKKYYSILPDLVTGWRPKNFKIAAPIFITYENILNDAIIKHFRNTPHKVVYLGKYDQIEGCRYPNSYKFHSFSEHEYNIKYELKCDDIPSKLQQGLQQFSLKCFEENRTFTGMNPKLIEELQFDSNFQSGNLDIVYKVSDKEYNLFLRPDTNTQGHMQWFYFKIKNHKYKHNSVKLNICNNKKAKTLFERGMKPFVLSKHLEKNFGIGWQQQGCNNIKYDKFQIKENFNYYSCFRNQTYSSFQLMENHYVLSFQYHFQTSNDTVYFSYCQPFTYSDMKNHLFSLKKFASNDLKIVQENLCTSLSGLEIPILTITNPKIPDSQKKCILAMARIHPGQSNGSLVMKGFLNYLVSEEAYFVRSKVIFKIIPMINPDGVVFGNYRTGLAGKDLNRKFRAKNFDLFPEVINLRTYVQKLKKELPCKFTYFLDFHGHSLKKNVFLYGPQYDIWTAKYEKAKILPKVLNEKTEMFRYQSCLFKVAVTKKSTARAFMLNLIPFCYTIESSVGLHRSEKNTNEYVCFSQRKWQEMGRHIGAAVSDSMDRLFESSLNFQLKKKKKNHKRQTKLKLEEKQNSKPKSTEVIRCKSSESFDGGKKKYLKSIKNFKKTNRKNLYFPQIKQEDNESDAYSEGKSDCQSQNNDLDKERYQQISGKIMKFIEKFNRQVIGEKKKYRLVKKKNLIPIKNARKKVGQHMKLVPSLKYKIAKGQISEKRIFLEERQDSILKGNRISLHRHKEQELKK